MGVSWVEIFIAEGWLGEGKAETHFIVPSVQRPEMDSAKEPAIAQRGQSSLAARDLFFPTRERGSTGHALCGSSIFWMVPAMQAASRLTMNSKPSLEMSVTWVEGAMVSCRRVVGSREDLEGVRVPRR